MGNVLIFGATSAIAAEVARLYAARGDRLFLVGRDPEKLSSLVTSIGDRVVGHESCDLNELESNAGRVQQAIDALGGLDIALIAHGYLGDQIRSETEFEHARQVLSTNYLSALSLLMPLANFFESQGRGHLAAITSVAGERGRPRNYTYGSAKGGLTKYLQGHAQPDVPDRRVDSQSEARARRHTDDR
jgi:short-subunit dehydrogenase